MLDENAGITQIQRVDVDGQFDIFRRGKVRSDGEPGGTECFAVLARHLQVKPEVFLQPRDRTRAGPSTRTVFGALSRIMFTSRSLFGLNQLFGQSRTMMRTACRNGGALTAARSSSSCFAKPR